MSPPTQASLELLPRKLRLPTIATCHQEVSSIAENNGWSFGQYLHHLLEQEVGDRRLRRIERLRNQSGLPADKTLATFEATRASAKVRRVLPSLCEGDFLQRAENVLAFGNPGTGKSHVASAIGHELVDRGYAVLYTPAYKLVQRLLVAKRELELESALKRLDRFEFVILDDLGYVQQNREEMEVLFTFLAERYERRSIMITSNLVFSQWDRIFKDPMTTAAAIDRLVHHSTILEMTGKSRRAEDAQVQGITTKEKEVAKK